MNRPHLPHPHLAQRFAHALEGVHLHHEPRWHGPPERDVPAATDWPDWPDWHWQDGGNW